MVLPWLLPGIRGLLRGHRGKPALGSLQEPGDTQAPLQLVGNPGLGQEGGTRVLRVPGDSPVLRRGQEGSPLGPVLHIRELLREQEGNRGLRLE